MVLRGINDPVDENESCEWANDHVDRALANTVSKVRIRPTGASVQHFVLSRLA
jgi:hypothetical protein